MKFKEFQLAMSKRGARSPLTKEHGGRFTLDYVCKVIRGLHPVTESFKEHVKIRLKIKIEV